MKNSCSPDTEAYWFLFSAQGGGVTLPTLLEKTTLTHCPIGSYPTHSHQPFPSDPSCSLFLQKLQACTHCKSLPIVIPTKQFTLQPCPPAVAGAGAQRGTGGSGTQKRSSPPPHGDPSGPPQRGIAGKQELPFAKYCEDLHLPTLSFSLPTDVKTGPFKTLIKKLQRKKLFTCLRRDQQSDCLTRTQRSLDSGSYPVSMAARL